jgi:hypothetical protein
MMMSTGSSTDEENDFDSVILMSLPAAETYDFYYVMGFTMGEDACRHIAAGEAVGVCDDQTLEMVMGIAGKPRTEADWEHLLATYVDGHILRMQTGCVLPHGRTGAACVERMIEKTERLGQEVGPELLDCYRHVSGGQMHYLDARRWRMTSWSLFHLERDINEVKQRLAQCSLRNFEVCLILVLKKKNVF